MRARDNHFPEIETLATDGDTVLQPLADNRESITGFLTNARIAGEATAERGEDLRAPFVSSQQPAAGRTLVHRPAHERMAEAEAPRDVGRAREAELEQHLVDHHPLLFPQRVAGIHHVQ